MTAIGALVYAAVLRSKARSTDRAPGDGRRMTSDGRDLPVASPSRFFRACAKNTA